MQTAGCVTTRPPEPAGSRPPIHRTAPLPERRSVPLSVPKRPPLLPGGRLAFERAIRYSSLPAPARHVALTLATWADIESGTIPDRFQPAQGTLEEATGLSRGAIFKHLKVLEEGGWIGREVGGGRSRRTAYWLLIPVGAVTSRRGNQSPGDLLPGNQSSGEPETSHVVHVNRSPGDYKSPPSPDESQPPSPPSPAADTPPPAQDREGGREDAPLTEEEQHAADALARVTAGVPQLVLGAREIHRLAPLVVPWLERTTEGVLREALTAGLPAVVGSPVGIVRRRLLDKLPPAASSMPQSRTGLPPWCGHCGDGMPAAEFNPRFRVRPDGALCACHPDALSA